MSTNPPAGRFPAWTPFLRRFTDERANDLRDTIALHHEVTSAWRVADWGNPRMLRATAQLGFNKLDSFMTELRGSGVPDYLRESVHECIRNIVSQETTIFTTPDIDWHTAHLSLKEQVDLRRFLRAQQYFLANEDRVIKALIEVIVTAFASVIDLMPNLSDAPASTMTVPLADAVKSLPDAVERIFSNFFSDDLGDLGLFTELRETLYLNICRASGIMPYEEPRKMFTPATKANMPAPELLSTYLGGTPFYPLLAAQAPFQIPRKTWASHGIVIAPPGHGKTQLLGSLVAEFLSSDDSPGLFILDPHGDLFHTARTRVDPARLVLLDPDTNAPPLNFLDFGASTEAQTLQTFQYLMSSLSGGLSDKQGALVPYVLKLLRLIPEASLETLRLMVDEKVKSPDKSAFAQYIAKLPAVDQGFFHSQFYHSSMDITKQAVGWKIYSAMSSDTFREMFGAKKNSINFDQLIAERKVVLVKGGFDSLAEDGMRVFLQFIVSQYYAAGMRRLRIPEHLRHLCVMLVDEASHVLASPIIARLLVDLRKTACAFAGATQVFEQIGQEVKAAVLGATAIKIVGPVSFSDANLLSRELGVGTTPEFVRGMQAAPGSHAEWAVYVSRTTDRAVKVRVPYGVLEAMPKQQPVRMIPHYIPEPNDDIIETSEPPAFTAYEQFLAAAQKQPRDDASSREAGTPHAKPAPKPAEQHKPTDADEPVIKPGKEWE
jgi:hypothetical protein